MKFWIVQKQSTADAIFAAIEAGGCTKEEEVEAIAAQLGDTVTWANLRVNGEA